jgi:hypothetical protein
MKIYRAIRDLGGEVLVVSFSAPARVAAYVKRYPLPFPVVSDPERQAYRAFGLDRTSWRRLLGPAVLARYLKLMVRGWMPWQKEKGADVLQLGGDFVLDAQRRLLYAHPSTVPTDRPAAGELLEVVRAAVQADARCKVRDLAPAFSLSITRNAADPYDNPRH